MSQSNALVLMAIAYFQPITRGELSQFLGREVSRDAIASLRGEGLIAAGPRSPTPGAPYAYVTTPGFLAQFGFESLRDLPDIEKLEDAGLLGRTSGDLLDGAALASELRGVLGLNERRRSTRGGCSIMLSDALGRQSVKFVSRVKFPNLAIEGGGIVINTGVVGSNPVSSTRKSA